MTFVSTDDLEPALRTTQQLLCDLSICSPGVSSQDPGASTKKTGASAVEPGACTGEHRATAQVPGASPQEPESSMGEPGASSLEPGARAWEPGDSSILDSLLKEMKAQLTKRDLELSRCGTHLLL